MIKPAQGQLGHSSLGKYSTLNLNIFPWHQITCKRRQIDVLYLISDGSEVGDYTESDDEGSDSYEPGGYHPVNIG